MPNLIPRFVQNRIYSQQILKATLKKNIQVRRTRHAGNGWRSKNELINGIVLWILTR